MHTDIHQAKLKFRSTDRCSSSETEQTVQCDVQQVQLMPRSDVRAMCERIETEQAVPS